MSATEIVRRLKTHDPQTFGRLNRSTVWDWIDYSGTRARWKDSVLKRVKQGNDPAYNKGGKCGILVRGWQLN